jgi:3-hydroxyisobutyrate dehydrogenase/putative dehydrogenase
MGAPMASGLARAGYSVAGYDVVPGRLDRLDAVTAAASPAEAARDAAIAVVMVANAAQAEEVIFGPDGLAAGLGAGTTLVVMSTVGPDPLPGWEQRLDCAGIALVDAPVSGGVQRAAEGRLLLMAAGAGEAIGYTRPVLQTVAGLVHVVGPRAGDAQKVKLVNQLLCGVHIAAAGEALAFAGAIGLDPRQCWEIIRQGAAASFMLDDRGARMVDAAFDDVRSAMDIFVKDMGLVTEAAGQAGLPVPIAATAGRLYRQGQQDGLGRKDDSSIIEVCRNRSVSALWAIQALRASPVPASRSGRSPRPSPSLSCRPSPGRSP